MNKKKVLALLLALVMTLTLVPVTALADDPEPASPDGVFVVNTNTQLDSALYNGYYTDDNNEVRNLSNGAIIQLGSDIDSYSSQYFTTKANSDFVLDLNGHTLWMKGSTVNRPSVSSGRIKVTANSTLTIRDTSAAQTGFVEKWGYTELFEVLGTLNIEGGTYSMTYGSPNSAVYLINRAGSNAQVNITGGHFISSFYVIGSKYQNGTINISGATLTSEGNVNSNAAIIYFEKANYRLTVNIGPGTVFRFGTVANPATAQETFTQAAGTGVLGRRSIIYCNSGYYTVNINGGDFTSLNQTFSNSAPTNSDLIINNGRFSFMPILPFTYGQVKSATLGDNVGYYYDGDDVVFCANDSIPEGKINVADKNATEYWWTGQASAYKNLSVIPTPTIYGHTSYSGLTATEFLALTSDVSLYKDVEFSASTHIVQDGGVLYLYLNKTGFPGTVEASHSIVTNGYHVIIPNKDVYIATDIACDELFGAPTGYHVVREAYSGDTDGFYYVYSLQEGSNEVVQVGDTFYSDVEDAIAAIDTTESETTEITITGDTNLGSINLTSGDTITVANTSAVANTDVSAKEVTIAKSGAATQTAYVVSDGQNTSVVTDGVDESIKNENVQAKALVKVADVLAAQVAAENSVAAADLTEVIIGVESTANENPPVNTVSYDVDPYAIIKQTAHDDQKVTLSNKDLAANASFTFQLDVTDIVSVAGATISAKHSWDADPDTNRAAGSEIKTYKSEAGANDTYFITVTTDHFSTWDLTYVEEGATVAVYDSINTLVGSYTSLPAAFAAVQNGETIVLLDNISLTERLFANAGATPAYAGTNNRYATTTENKSITLDLNNHNIQSTSNIALAGGSLNITGSGTISTSASGMAPVEIRGTGDLTSKRTLTIGSDVTLDGSTTGYGLNVFGSNDAQENLIDVTVNGTVNGTLFVLGNLTNTENEINIVVNGTVTSDSAVGIALNGFASVTVNDPADVSGTTGIEVRAGNLTVNGGNITGTASTYTSASNSSGSATSGAGIAVAQHTTGLPITTTLSGGNVTAVNTTTAVAVDSVESGTNMAIINVTAEESFVESQSVIPDGYEWKETTPGTYKVVEKELTFRGGSLRRRVITGTTTVVDYETDLRFGFMLPAGAVVNTSESYFRWSLSDNVDANTGNLINITRVDTSGSRPLVNMVITKIPTAYYTSEIYCHAHIVYTISGVSHTIDTHVDGNDPIKRSVKDVCEGLIAKNDTTTVWPDYAQSLKTAAGWANQ